MKPENSHDENTVSVADSAARRSSKRIRLLKDVRVNISTEDDKVPAYMLDISKTGMKVKTNKMFTPGDTFNLILSLKETVECKVKWVRKVSIKRDEYDVGLEFKTDLNIDLDTMSNFFDVEERREFKRKTIKKPLYVDICDIKNGSNLRDVVKILDISEGGVKLELKRPLTAGVVLSLKMQSGSLVYGEVRWTVKANRYKKTYYAGIRFINNPLEKIVTKDEQGNITERGERLANAPTMVSYYNELAISFRKAGNFSEALYSYEKALKVDPDNEILFFNLAMVSVDTKNIPAAISALESALKVDPDFLEAKSLLDRLLRN